MEYKIYLTFEVSPPDDPEWEWCDYGAEPDEIAECFVRDIQYRLGHIPGGKILEYEIK
jgi:hypothetical protein